MHGDILSARCRGIDLRGEGVINGGDDAIRNEYGLLGEATSTSRLPASDDRPAILAEHIEMMCSCEI